MGVTILQTGVRRRWVRAASILAVLTSACTATAESRLAVSTPTPAPAPPPPPAGDAVIAPPPAEFEGAPPVRRDPPAQLSQRATPGPGTWAVIIGVNDYPGTAHDLRSAVADADDIDAALAGMGVPADHRMVLRDGQVTRAVLRSAAEWLTRVAGPEAVAVFAFAGHVRKSGSSTESMVTADGATVTDAELAAIFQGLQARRAWVVMAACYGGGFTEVLRPGVVLTGAAPADKEAFENTTFGNSYLVEFMVNQAITGGRAADTVQSAFEYARQELSQRFPARVPEQFDQAGGPLDLRPAGVPRPPPSARAVATTGTGGSTAGNDNTQSGGGGGAATTTTTPPPSSTSTTTAPPPSPDKCKGLTAGVITCSSSR